jgi:uncharacterized RmlC-like cupin family protein
LIILGGRKKEAGIEAAAGCLLPPTGLPHLEINVVGKTHEKLAIKTNVCSAGSR